MLDSAFFYLHTGRMLRSWSMTKTYIDSDGHVACAQCGAVNPSSPCQSCIEHEAKRQRNLAEQREAAAKLSLELSSIKRVETPKGWRFEATMNDGSTFVIRAVATRPYTMAAIHDLGVVSKFERCDFRSFITLHQATPKPAGNWDAILRILPINEMVVAL